MANIQNSQKRENDRNGVKRKAVPDSTKKPVKKTGQRAGQAKGQKYVGQELAKTQKLGAKQLQKQTPVKRQDINLVREHRKVTFPKPGNFLYPVPAVMVSCQDAAGKPNIITLAWAGTICSDPPMLSVSIRKERYSHALIRQSGEFVVNLTTEALAWATDYCGVKSGRDVDKFKACGLTPGKIAQISAPTIEEAPVSIACKVKQILELGTHDMFVAEVLSVQVDSAYMDEKGSFHLEDAGLIAYAHGRYFALGELLGTFGYSVKKSAKMK